jgi:fucose 4-O-acetylase-like acetyltransferase
MTRTGLPFFDWMKCLGMFVIVAGHVAAPWAMPWTPPINPKQLGVAFFLFVTGFALAREARPSLKVLFNRLFAVYLFGIACALVLSAVTYAREGRLALSNYLPFLLGANVVRDSFPANPTTWYIGTYLHVLLLWALVLRGRRIRAWVILVAALAEVLIRAALAEHVGALVAYMAFPNWATVFLLGMYYGQRPEAPRGGNDPYRLAACLLGLCLLVGAWPLLWAPAGKEPLALRWFGIGLPLGSGAVPLAAYEELAFPFMWLQIGPRLVDLAVTSAAVTFLYVAHTWLVFQITRRLPAPAVVGFLARNTLIVFIAHMPVYYALVRLLKGWELPYAARVAIWFLACFPVLAVLSEVISRVVRPRALGERAWLLLHQAAPALLARQAPRAEASRPGAPLP